MIIKSLRLKNFYGIKYGLGLDELKLTIPDGKLIAVVGNNGSGKTTVMDNMHPYKTMPFRADAEFYRQVYGIGEKEVVWQTSDGVEYRSQIIIDSKKRKTICYLYDKNGNRLTDGRNDEYEKAIENILMPEKLFFTIAFRSQNQRSFSSYTKGELKDLFNEIIDLERYYFVMERTKEKYSSALKEYELIEREKETLESSLSVMKVLLSEEQEKEKREALEKVKQQIDEIKKQIDSVLEKKNAVEQQLGKIVDTINKMDNEFNKKTAEIKSIIEQRKQIIEKNKNEANRLKETIELKEKIEEAEKSIKLIEEVIEKKTRHEFLAGEIEKSLKILQRKDEILSAEKEQITLEEKLKSLNVAKDKLKELEVRLKNINKELDEMKNLEDIDCPKANPDDCILYRAVSEKIALIPELKKEKEIIEKSMKEMGMLADIQEEIQKTESRLKDIRDIVRDKALISFTEENIDKYRREIESIERDMGLYPDEIKKLSLNELKNKKDELSVLAGKKAMLDYAVNRLPEMEKENETYSIEIKQKTDEIQRIKNEYDVEMAKQKQAELLLIDEYRKIDMEYNSMNDRYKALTEQKIIFEQELKNNDEQKKNMAEIKNRIHSLESKLQKLNTEKEQWKVISNAYSKDGIMVYEIEMAIPRITSIANSLLSVVDRFTVEISTQSQTLKGKTKEAMDILVYDTENGSVRYIEDLSGGERVWIDEAIALAFLIYHQKSEGTRINTLFMDERDGSLDSGTKFKYFQMKKKAMDIGGYKQCFFVTHDKIAMSIADCVMNFAPEQRKILISKQPDSMIFEREIKKENTLNRERERGGSVYGN